MRATRKKEWFDEEAFWRDFCLFMFSERRFAEAADQVPKLLSLVKPAGRAILDLCCGPGRFAIPLAKKGFRVTGVDRSQYLLRKARAKARSGKVSVDWVGEDMRDFLRPGAFDLAINMFTSFGYFDTEQEDALVLANILKSLRPGGALVIDVMGKEVLARIAQPAFCDVLPDGSKLVQRAEIIDGWSRIRHEWILIRRGAARTFRFQTTLYSGRELAALLLGAGFNQVKLYGSLDGEDYGLNAKRLIAVARKAVRQQ
jgi:SAM-dependent methyltransferase